MSWHIEQRVRLGRDGEMGTIDHILEIEGGYEIYVKRDNMIIPWKKTTMDSTVEYDIVF